MYFRPKEASRSESRAEVLDPNNGSWTCLPELKSPRLESPHYRESDGCCYEVSAVAVHKTNIILSMFCMRVIQTVDGSHTLRQRLILCGLHIMSTSDGTLFLLDQ